jgi:hypothetical protein
MMGRQEEGSGRWDLEKETNCFECRRNAIQLVMIGGSEATVTCNGCMAERHYTIHRARRPQRGNGNGPSDNGNQKDVRNGVWHFHFVDRCMNCGNCVANDISVSESRVRAVCPACYFTRSYEFNMLTGSRARR